MKKYYLNGNERDALSFEELQAKALQTTDYVWFEGLDDWKKIEEIEELQKLIKKPPKVGSDSVLIETKGWKIISLIENLLFIILIVWVVWCGYDKFTTGSYNFFSIKDMLLKINIGISENSIKSLDIPIIIPLFMFLFSKLNAEKKSGKYIKVKGKTE